MKRHQNLYSNKKARTNLRRKLDDNSGRLDVSAVVTYVHTKNTTAPDKWKVIRVADLQIRQAVMEGMYEFPCPMCGTKMKVITNVAHYGPYAAGVKPGYRWVCPSPGDCDTNIGCHGKTYVPLGMPADYDLRKLRQECHKMFDILWKTAGFHRPSAYKWLAKRLRIPVSECHIALFCGDMCREAIGILTGYIRKLNRISDEEVEGV